MAGVCASKFSFPTAIVAVTELLMGHELWF